MTLKKKGGGGVLEPETVGCKKAPLVLLPLAEALLYEGAQVVALAAQQLLGRDVEVTHQAAPHRLPLSVLVPCQVYGQLFRTTVLSPGRGRKIKTEIITCGVAQLVARRAELRRPRVRISVEALYLSGN
jgi:hypothetical protein